MQQSCEPRAQQRLFDGLCIETQRAEQFNDFGFVVLSDSVYLRLTYFIFISFLHHNKAYYISTITPLQKTS